MLATSLPVAQWLERPTGVRKVMGSIPVGNSEFFFVPRSQHAEYSIFSCLDVWFFCFLGKLVKLSVKLFSLVFRPCTDIYNFQGNCHFFVIVKCFLV